MHLYIKVTMPLLTDYSYTFCNRVDFYDIKVK